jgi:PST family polysaccharide transporter
MTDAATERSETAEAPGAHSHLAHRAASGVRWALVSTSSQQIVRVVFTIVLARIIGPSDFGIAATAAVYVGTTQLFIDSGFGSALIQKKEIDDLDIGSVFWINMVVGAAMVLATLVGAPWLADFFHTPELSTVLRVTSVLIMINALAVVPTSLLNRKLAWRPIAISQMVGVVVGGAASVVAAAMGARYWAVIIQAIVIGAITTTGLMLATGAPRVRASAQRLRALWAFTWGLMGSRSLRYFSENIDNVLVARYLGTADLAFYGLAYRLLKLPVRLIGQVVNQVSLPAFSRMQQNKERMRRWFITSSRSMATSTYPFLVVGILVMPELIPLLFGREWEEAVLPTQLLALVAMRQMAMMVAGPLFVALGKTKEQFFLTVLTVTANLAGIVIGLNWGIVGVAAGLAISMYLITPMQIAVVARQAGLQRSEYTRALMPAWIAAAAMVAVWVPSRTLCTVLDVPAVAASAICGLLAFATYFATLRFAFRELYDSMHEVAMVLLHRGGRGGGRPVARASAG